MQDWIIRIMEQFGYWGIMLLIAIENIFPPIPSEIILTFGGFMTTDPRTHMNIWIVCLFATFGSVGGAVILYGLGKILSRERLYWIIDKWGKILRLKRKDLDNAENWFAKKGGVTVFLCRFIPIIRSLISIPAGMAGMNMGKFLLLTTVGTAIWNIVLVNLGALMGNEWERIVKFMDTYSTVAAILLAIIGVAAITWFIIKRRKAPIKDLAE